MSPAIEPNQYQSFFLLFFIFASKTIEILFVRECNAMLHWIYIYDNYFQFITYSTNFTYFLNTSWSQLRNMHHTIFAWSFLYNHANLFARHMFLDYLYDRSFKNISNNKFIGNSFDNLNRIGNALLIIGRNKDSTVIFNINFNSGCFDNSINFFFPTPHYLSFFFLFNIHFYFPFS